MPDITIEPHLVWKYFQSNKDELTKTMKVIAENKDWGVVVYITEDNGFPCCIVTADGCQYAEETAHSSSECVSMIDKIYDLYLTDKFLSVDTEASEFHWDEDESLLDEEDEISEREIELDDAVMTMLNSILEEDADIVIGIQVDKVCEDVKDHILEYLARKHNLSIRRPMILEDDETGEDFFTEYPYTCMVYDDEDNPIYKQ